MRSADSSPYSSYFFYRTFEGFHFQLHEHSVQIDCSDMAEAQARPDDFMKALQQAEQVRHEFFETTIRQGVEDYSDLRRFLEPDRFYLMQGLHDIHNGSLRQMDDDPAYLTKYVIDDWYVRTGEEPYAMQYIRFDAHKQLLEQAVDATKMDFESIVARHVRLGVEQGIEQATRASVGTLQKVQQERERLKAEHAKIEKQLVKLDAREKELEARKLRKRRENPAGYVYLLRVPDRPGVYKIGRTVNPSNRLQTFSVKLPFEVAYDTLISTADMYALEAELHKRFGDQRLEGSEFFALTDADVAYVRSLANQGEG